jgi:4-amino-4-deoxychorismate lyase
MPAEGAVRDGNVPDYELIETMKWDPEGSFLRLDRHLARLYRSAAELGFVADPERIGTALSQAIGNRVPLRVRLTLASDGTAKAVTQPLEQVSDDPFWTLGIASIRLNANDPLLRHKTTRREIYDVARTEMSRDEADEVLLLNGNGEVCEGTITNVFADFGDQVLATPPVECGLLPGVLRGALLDIGRARQVVLTPERLAEARTIYVGNSLRGLIPARLR